MKGNTMYFGGGFSRIGSGGQASPNKVVGHYMFIYIQLFLYKANL